MGSRRRRSHNDPRPDRPDLGSALRAGASRRRDPRDLHRAPRDPERARRPDPRPPPRADPEPYERRSGRRRPSGLLRPQARARARRPRSGEPSPSDLRREAPPGPAGEPQPAPKVPVVPTSRSRAELEPVPALRLPSRSGRRPRAPMPPPKLRSDRPSTTPLRVVLLKLRSRPRSLILRFVDAPENLCSESPLDNSRRGLVPLNNPPL